MKGSIHFYATDGEGRAFLRGEIDLLERRAVSVSVEEGAEMEITVGLGVLADAVCAAFEQTAATPRSGERQREEAVRRV